MAETKRMTAEQVVSYLLEGEGLDFLRESLRWVVQQLMEAEVSELIGAGRGERAPEERLTHRNGYRPRRWDDARRRDRAGDPEAPARQLLPELPGAAPALRAGAGVRWSRRRTSPASRRARSTRWSSRSGCGSRRARSRGSARPGRAGRGVPQPAARGPLPVPVAGREGREGPRRRPRRAQVPGDRLRRARVRLPRGDRRSTSAKPRPRRSGAASCARWSSAA